MDIREVVTPLYPHNLSLHKRHSLSRFLAFAVRGTWQRENRPMAVALAPVSDPVVDFLIDAGDGVWSDANVNSAGADVQISLNPQHWLHTASSGATTVAFRQLEAAFAAALFVEEPAALGQLLTQRALSPVKMAGVLRAAISAGLSAEPQGSVKGALRYLVSFVRSRRAEARATFSVAAATDFVSLPVAAGATRLAANQRWVEKLSAAMAVDPDGDALVLAALINVLPHRYSPAGRNGDAFKECVAELFEMAAAKSSSMGTKTLRAQAAAIVATVAGKEQDALLLTFATSEAAADVAAAYSLDGVEWLKPRFLEAWRYTYTYVASLLTDKCSGRDAWAHVARLLYREPTAELLSALDARVGRLLSSIDSDASLRGVGVSISTRVAEMEKLLGASAATKTAADEGGSAAAGASLKDPMERAKLFALPEVKLLVAGLDKLNTSPLDEPKVIKELLTNACPLGAIWLSGVKFTHPLFDKLLPCRERSQVVLAYKHLMCRVHGKVKVDEYDRFDNKAGECPLPNQMVQGTFATSKGLHFNPWLDIVAPRIAVVDGDHAVPTSCNNLAALNPCAIFCSEYMLRLGMDHLVRAFGFMGLAEAATAAAPGTLSSALETLRLDALRIDRLPNHILDAEGTYLSLVESKDAARAALRTAGARAFMDYAERIRSMLATPPESARRPTEFVPAGCGMITTESKVETILAPMESRLNQRLAINRSRADLQPDYGIFAAADPNNMVESAPSLAGTNARAPDPAAAQRAASFLSTLSTPSSVAGGGMLPPPPAWPPTMVQGLSDRPLSPAHSDPVSYTHLTLPTKRIV